MGHIKFGPVGFTCFLPGFVHMLCLLTRLFHCNAVWTVLFRNGGAQVAFFFFWLCALLLWGVCSYLSNELFWKDLRHLFEIESVGREWFFYYERIMGNISDVNLAKLEIEDVSNAHFIVLPNCAKSMDVFILQGEFARRLQNLNYVYVMVYRETCLVRLMTVQPE